MEYPSSLCKSTLLSLWLLASVLIDGTFASDCTTAEYFSLYNSTRSYPIPALSLSQESTSSLPSIVADTSKNWYLVSRYATEDEPDGMNQFWVNTGDSNTTGINACAEMTWSYGINGFAFSKSVLQRSVNDNGDCRTMLGGDCVDALMEHYMASATSEMMSGSCNGGTPWNTTVPYQCADVVGDDLIWNGGFLRTGSNLNSTYDNATYLNSSCPGVQPLNSSMHGVVGIGNPYNESVRFPTPVFWTFWPNRSSVNEYQPSWQEDVHVEIKCMRPDEIREGSVAPPSAQELLAAKDVMYDQNVTNGAMGLSVGLGFGGLQGWVSVVGAAIMVASLLM